MQVTTWCNYNGADFEVSKMNTAIIGGSDDPHLSNFIDKIIVMDYFYFGNFIMFTRGYKL